jgi:hypothetical protein
VRIIARSRNDLAAGDDREGVTPDQPDSRGAGPTGVAVPRRVLSAGLGALSAAHAWLLPAWLPVVLVLAAIPLVRPNVLGEQNLSPIGFALLCLAAAVALLQRRGIDPRDPAATARRPFDPAIALIVCVALGYLWVLLYTAATNPGPLAKATLQSIFLTVGSLVALAVVCADPQARVRVVRGFVVIVTVLCASYAVTALIWAAAGVGSGKIAMFPTGAWGLQPLYFPFTTTAAFQPVFGISFPRFTGLGREPGWMAMYCAVAFFLADAVGIGTRRVKALLIVGLLGCVSTAGFGVFVVTWAYSRFLRDRGGITMVNYLRQVGGVGATVVALWLAVTAPVLGLSAKSTQNATSLDERRAATEAGIKAFFDSPLGGDIHLVQGGINLISDIAVSGLPFVVLVCVGLLLTTIGSGGTRGGSAVTAVVFLTLLTSQPPRDSTWAFGVVILAATLHRSDTPLQHARRHTPMKEMP